MSVDNVSWYLINIFFFDLVHIPVDTINVQGGRPETI